MHITLLSDFGLHDPSVAVVKGVLMQYTKEPITDITHEIKPFFAPEAAYLFSTAYLHFPAGSCHLLLFDIFSDATPRLILSEENDHFFLSPDNGLLPMALGRVPARSWLCYELVPGASFIDWLHAAGRAIRLLENNKNTPELPETTLKSAKQSPPLTSSGIILCEVLHVDHYENVVLNFTKQQYDTLPNKQRFRLQFRQVEEISEISTNYSAVREGTKLCRFNSSGYLEICVNRGKAASLFGLRPGSKFNDIKITAE